MDACINRQVALHQLHDGKCRVWQYDLYNRFCSKVFDLSVCFMFVLSGWTLWPRSTFFRAPVCQSITVTLRCLRGVLRMPPVKPVLNSQACSCIAPWPFEAGASKEKDQTPLPKQNNTVTLCLCCCRTRDYTTPSSKHLL